MDNFSSLRLGRAKARTGSLQATRYLLRLVLLLSFGFFAGHAAAQSVDPAGPSLPFAVADFDGDFRPDLANVLAGPSDSSETDYWIQLQLTTDGHQSIEVVAPIGGLQITARDVNGDQAVDLVLTTTWLNQPVAILLNNGYGSFTRVAPTAFAAAFRGAKTNCASGGDHVRAAVGIATPSRPGLFLETRRLHYYQARISFLPPSRSWLLPRPVLISNLGRAPPSQNSPF